MKFLTIAFTFFSFSVFAQTDSVLVSTTDREYNYLTLGYGDQVIRQGGDLINGYALIESGSEIQMKSFKISTSLFVRTKTNTICAGLIIVKSDYSGKTYYLCVPINNWELTEKFYRELDALDGNLNRELAKVTSAFYVTSMFAAYEVTKTKKK